MKVTLRWYGSENDNISLNQIKQIPGVTGVVGTILDIPVGEVWELNRILRLKKEVESYGLKLEVIESVNVHEDIKLGLTTRDKYIENYKETLKNLSTLGIKVVCYNFMPVFDWFRTDLSKELPDGSTVFSYKEEIFEKIDKDNIFKEMLEKFDGFNMPGWEEERLNKIKGLYTEYKNVNEEKLWENLEYFLKEIIPVAEELDTKMAIHPDDPPWSIFGLPRIIKSKKDLERLISLVDSKYNGIVLCSGSLGANRDNNIPELIRYFGKKGRIHFAHVRNIKFHKGRNFDESSHKTEDGSLDMYEIMKAYYDIGFDGYIRPDHGRMIWGEKARPGYGLYDRALGVAYLNGLWGAINKEGKEKSKCIQI